MMFAVSWRLVLYASLAAFAAGGYGGYKIANTYYTAKTVTAQKEQADADVFVLQEIIKEQAKVIDEDATTAQANAVILEQWKVKANEMEAKAGPGVGLSVDNVTGVREFFALTNGSANSTGPAKGKNGKTRVRTP